MYSGKGSFLENGALNKKRKEESPATRLIYEIQKRMFPIFISPREIVVQYKKI